MKRQTKMVIGIIVMLAIAIGILLYLNQGNRQQGEMSQKDQTFLIGIEGKELVSVSREDLTSMEIEEFPAVVRSSGKKPVEVTFKGVALSAILAKYDLNLTDKTQVNVKAVDGYTVALSVSEVQESKNVYLVFEMDGKPLKKKEDGGNGPYQMVIRQDPFSQRWCKYIGEVLVQ